MIQGFQFLTGSFSTISFRSRNCFCSFLLLQLREALYFTKNDSASSPKSKSKLKFFPPKELKTLRKSGIFRRSFTLVRRQKADYCRDFFVR